VRPYSDWGVVSVRAPVWIPQNSTPTQQDDPRAHLLPVNIPNGVSIDANIATARAAYDSFSLKGGSEPGAAEARASMLNYNRLEWFNSMVQDKGSWDYKYANPDHTVYENFGNFNYGATGAAVHFSADTLLHVAGWVQQHGGDAATGSGTMSSSFIEALAGKGGAYPYGHNRNDAFWVQRVVDYYDCRQAHPR
jgi:hypothetical protein